MQVYIVLYVKADLEGIDSLQLTPNCSFEFDLKETGGQEERRGVHVDDSEEHELTGSRGTAHFAMKWTKDSKHMATMNLERTLKGVFAPEKGVTSDDHGSFVPLVGFDCRGVEPIAWYPKDEFIAVGSSGQVWNEGVDLSELEWYEYDQKSGESVSITGLEYEFRVMKK